MIVTKSTDAVERLAILSFFHSCPLAELQHPSVIQQKLFFSHLNYVADKHYVPTTF